MRFFQKPKITSWHFWHTKMEVMAFRVAWIPALAIEMVCCSIASWIATWSLLSILSNSSMQQIPLSALRNSQNQKQNFQSDLTNSSLQQPHLLYYDIYDITNIKAPASMLNSPVSESRTTLAVSPAAEDAYNKKSSSKPSKPSKRDRLNKKIFFSNSLFFL